MIGIYEKIEIGDRIFSNIPYYIFGYLCNEEENNLMQKDRSSAVNIINSKIILRLEKEHKIVTTVNYQYDIKQKRWGFVYYFVKIPEIYFN